MQRPDSLQAHVRDHYDRVAQGYDALLETPANRLVRECFWRNVEQAVGTRARMLDFGAGSGLDAAHFAGLGHEVVAYDLSDGMIAALRRRCAAELEAGSVVALAGPLEAVGESLAERAPFDAAVSNFAVFSTVDPLAPVFRLLGRLVRPGGSLILTVQNPWYPASIRRSAFWRAVLAAPFTGGLRYRSAELHHVRHHTVGRLRRAARPEFVPDERPMPECSASCFGPRSAFRIVRLRRQ